MAPQQLPARQKQRNVEHNHDHTDGGPGERRVDDLGHTGNTAEGNVVGFIAPVEAQSIECRGRGDQTVGPK